jgi:hypothetical protein
MNQITAIRKGHVARVEGPGFSYFKAGDTSRFTQKGKIPSIRAAKAFCKLFASDQLG